MPKTDVTFWLEGEPVAKARPRMTRSGHVYTPDKTTKAENAIRRAWQETDGEMIEGPVSLSVTYRLQTPKAWSKAKKYLAKVLEILPVKKPDLDNLIKLTADGLVGMAFCDDKQICEIHAYKVYDDTPGTVIRVREI
ncbi:MAG: RusA family crossover junction endodeoxyribonuclease [Eubacterium sp.]|nr:RusA family crossover junction endodeoxyribonuclease [Eubacterium sp.]MBQ2099488.1 RusA family crossover junction endodeoxyribonuclease [Lachnospiraceae bacterium]